MHCSNMYSNESVYFFTGIGKMISSVHHCITVKMEFHGIFANFHEFGIFANLGFARIELFIVHSRSFIAWYSQMQK